MTLRADSKTPLGVPWRTWLVRAGSVIALVVALEYFALHTLVAARKSWNSALQVAPWALVVALALELASWACYSAMSRGVLSDEGRPAYPMLLAIDLSGNGVSRVVPGGGATAAAFRFRLMARAGIPSGQAAGAAALESAINSVWAVAIFMAGVVLAVPVAAAQPLVRIAAVVAAVVVTVFGGLVAVVIARPDELVDLSQRIAHRVPFLSARVLERVVATFVAQINLLMRNPTLRRRALLWGFGYSAFDAACLYVCVAAFGNVMSPGGLLTTYGLVSLLSLLPITPGGIGIVEGVGVPTLVSFGAPGQAALLGVLTWRLLQFWLPIPVGAGSYFWLRRRLARSG